MSLEFGSQWLEIAVAVALFGGLLGAFELAYWAGSRVAQRAAEDAGPLGTIQGAVLGLLGLLLGFSFAGAAGRFIDRQDLIVSEANAIGTAYLRADLLDEPFRGELRTALREYTASRVELFEAQGRGLEAVARAEEQSAAVHPRVWQAALRGVQGAPQLALAVLAPVNEVIDLHTTHMAATRRHLPALVVAILVAAAAVTLGTLGYGFGLSRQRHSVLACAVTFLVAAALWLTIDLDYPSHGLIRIGQGPMLELERNLAAP